MGFSALIFRPNILMLVIGLMGYESDGAEGGYSKTGWSISAVVVVEFASEEINAERRGRFVVAAIMDGKIFDANMTTKSSGKTAEDSDELSDRCLWSLLARDLHVGLEL